jgi:N-acetyl-anhydromuramyl-L-alanine amidase AmpD
MDKYPAAPENYGSRKGAAVDLIVIHTTQGLGAVNGTLAWFQNPKAQVSAHYVVAQSGMVYRCVGEDFNAWHCGAYNRHSIGIEVEGDVDQALATWTPTVLGALVSLTADLCTRHAIPVAHTFPNPDGTIPSGITGHMDLGELGGNHDDPGEAFPWFEYLAGVTAAMQPEDVA